MIHINTNKIGCHENLFEIESIIEQVSLWDHWTAMPMP